MVEYENQCVGCPPNMGCLGNSCPNVNVPVFYCDECKDYAEYRIDGDDYCEDCAKKYFINEFSSLPVNEMSELLNIEITEPEEIEE